MMPGQHASPESDDRLRPGLNVVAPSLDDPVIAPAAAVLGGPPGWFADFRSGRYWTPVKLVLVLGVLGYMLGMLSKIHCTSTGWASPSRYTHLCYSDIPALFSSRGFADNVFPYLGTALPGQEQLEYPVLTGMFMQVANIFTPRQGEVTLNFYYANVVMLSVALIVTVVATAVTVRRRPWDAAMVGLAPGMILSATINWDLLAVGLTAVAMAFWARKHPTTAGVFLGLAAAAKFYPFILLGPLLILCLRAGRMRAFWQASAGAVVAWLIVNLPFMLLNFEGWFHFYKFSSERGEDFGSIWLVLTTAGFHVDADSLNSLATGMFILLCLAIAMLGLRAARRPRLASMFFLVIAAFLITNKVYSPQYVLWLIPLAALARPRWRDFLIWQAAEVTYFVAIWLYLAGLGENLKGLPVGWYCVAVIIHILGTCYFAAMVIRDMLAPENDPVRTDGWPEDRDDPGGGVLDGAADRWTLRRTPQPDQSSSV